MREYTRTGRYFHSINPDAVLAGVAEQLRSLSAIGVVRRRNPPYLIRSYADNVILSPFGRGYWPYEAASYGDQGDDRKKDFVHLALSIETALVAQLVHRATVLPKHVTMFRPSPFCCEQITARACSADQNSSL